MTFFQEFLDSAELQGLGEPLVLLVPLALLVLKERLGTLVLTEQLAQQVLRGLLAQQARTQTSLDRQAQLVQQALRVLRELTLLLRGLQAL